MNILLSCVCMVLSIAAAGGVSAADEPAGPANVARLQQRLTERRQLTSQREAQLDEERRVDAARRVALEAERARLAREAVALELRRQRLERTLEGLAREAEAADRSAADLSRAAQRLRESASTLADQVRVHALEAPGLEAAAEQVLGAGEAMTAEQWAGGYERLMATVDELDRRGQSTSVRLHQLRTVDGRVEEVELLSIGSVAFAYRKADRIGYAFGAPADASGYRWREDLPSALGRDLGKAFEQVTSAETRLLSAPVDVTGRLRAEAEIGRSGVVGWLASGGPVMWPLGLVAIACAVLLGERAVVLYLGNASDAGLAKQVVAEIRAGRMECALAAARRRRNSVGRVVSALLARWEGGRHAMEDSVQEQLLYEWPRLNRFLRGIGILAAIAPLLGLLGTVTGIIETFAVIRTTGQSGPGMMAGGIAQALVTTATGLGIAIPVVFLNGVLRSRVDRILALAEEQAAAVLNAALYDAAAERDAREGTDD